MTEAPYLYQEATGYDFLEFYPNANEELHKMFGALDDFKISEDGIVTLSDVELDNIEEVKKKYLVTENDKKCKRPKLT